MAVYTTAKQCHRIIKLCLWETSHSMSQQCLCEKSCGTLRHMTSVGNVVYRFHSARSGAEQGILDGIAMCSETMAQDTLVRNAYRFYDSTCAGEIKPFLKAYQQCAGTQWHKTPQSKVRTAFTTLPVPAEIKPFLRA